MSKVKSECKSEPKSESKSSPPVAGLTATVAAGRSQLTWAAALAATSTAAASSSRDEYDDEYLNAASDYDERDPSACAPRACVPRACPGRRPSPGPLPFPFL